MCSELRFTQLHAGYLVAPPDGSNFDPHALGRPLYVVRERPALGDWMAITPDICVLRTGTRRECIASCEADVPHYFRYGDAVTL